MFSEGDSSVKKFNETFLELVGGYMNKIQGLFVGVAEEVQLERR